MPVPFWAERTRNRGTWAGVLSSTETERILRHCQTENRGGIPRQTFEIVGNDPRHPAILQNFACRLPILTEKKTRALLNSFQALVRASSHARLPRPIGNRRRKPPRRKKRALLGRSQIDCQFAQLHRFVSLFDSASELGLIGPEARVPITQDRKDRQYKSDRNRRARFDRLEQSWKCNCKDQNEKIRPARLPNREEIGGDEDNVNWQRATTLARPARRLLAF